jgi:hypothetical protein
VHGCLKRVRSRVLLHLSLVLTPACYRTVGLGIDCSPWVEAGLIAHAGMLDRNWALWTTFCQVRLNTHHAYSPVDVTFQDTTWSLYVGREFCTTSSVNSQTIPVPFVTPDLDPFLGNWPPEENETPNRISGTFVATCSLMQIAREVADAVYVGPQGVLVPGLLMVDCSSDFSRLGGRQEANEFRIAQME